MPKYKLGNDIFSYDEFGDIWWANLFNVTIFMVNPKGELLMYIPNTSDKDGKVIKKGLPHDIFHPEGKKLYWILQGDVKD